MNVATLSPIGSSSDNDTWMARILILKDAQNGQKNGCVIGISSLSKRWWMVDINKICFWKRDVDGGPLSTRYLIGAINVNVLHELSHIQSGDRDDLCDSWTRFLWWKVCEPTEEETMKIGVVGVAADKVTRRP